MPYQSLSPNLYVRDIDTSLAFYRDILGFQVAMTMPETAPYDWTMLTSGAVTIMLEKRSEGDTASFDRTTAGDALVLFIQTDDIRGLYASVKDRTPLEKEMHRTFYGMDEFAVRDPDGFVLVFAQQAQEAQDAGQS